MSTKTLLGIVVMVTTLGCGVADEASGSSDDHLESASDSNDTFSVTATVAGVCR